MTRILTIASEFGTLFMSIKDKPKPLDYIGLGLRSTELAVKLRNEYRLHKSRDGGRYFTPEESGEVWCGVPEEFKDTLKKYVLDASSVLSHWSGTKESYCPVVGYLGKEKIGWLEKDGKECGFGPYYVLERRKETFDTLGNLIWEDIGDNHCVFVNGSVSNKDGKIGIDTFDLSGFKASGIMNRIKERIKCFLDKKIHRSVLIQGPPGSGKSSTARWLAREFGLRSLSVNMANSSYAAYQLQSMIKVMQPGVIILDDFDRAANSYGMIEFLEVANQCCKLVLITTNCKDSMVGALLRPGRIDDVIHLNRLDRDFILSLVNNDEKVADVLEQLPAAYISEFLKRVEAIGPDLAKVELPELIDRAREIEIKTEEEKKMLKELNMRLSSAISSASKSTGFDPKDE